MNRKLTTILVAVAVVFFVGANLVSDSEAGESLAAPAPVAEVGCAGSSQPALLIARWTPVRNLFTRARIRRAARRSCSGYSAPQAASGCSGSVQAMQPVQVISVSPIRLFRSCANSQCR